MLKLKLYFTLIFLTRLSLIFTDDFYAKFHQRDYRVDFQRTELVYYNKSIFNVFEMKTFKYNRTLPVINATVNTKVTMGSELEAEVQFYKFLSNEYRQLRGTKFQVNYCKSVKENLVGLEMMYNCGNLSRCEIVKGITYEVCNFYPDESRFPPFVPSGEYKFQLDAIYRDKIIATVAAYIKIYRPVARFEKRV